MEDKKFCQSCGMPMEKEEDFGTERDGSRNEDYCCYCYKDGSFTGDMTMEDMIRFNLKLMRKTEILSVRRRKQKK